MKMRKGQVYTDLRCLLWSLHTGSPPNRLCWPLEGSWEVSQAPQCQQLGSHNLIIGTVLCSVGCLAASLALIQEMPIVPPYPVMTNKNVFRYYQTCSGVAILSPVFPSCPIVRFSFQLTRHLRGNTVWVEFCACRSLKASEAHDLSL